MMPFKKGDGDLKVWVWKMASENINQKKILCTEIMQILLLFLRHF